MSLNPYSYSAKQNITLKARYFREADELKYRRVPCHSEIEVLRTLGSM